MTTLDGPTNFDKKHFHFHLAEYFQISLKLYFENQRLFGSMFNFLKTEVLQAIFYSISAFTLF